MIKLNDSRPYYLQLIKVIKDEIKKGSWKPDEKIYTEKELCARFKVSNTTVNKALDELVRQGLLYRIRSKGTFVAGDKEQKKSFIIGLVFNNTANPFFARLIKVVQTKALKAEYDVIYYANNNFIEESKSIEKLIKTGVDGVILVSSLDKHEAELIKKLATEDIPFVYLNRFLKET